jgi:hypothetical protein
MTEVQYDIPPCAKGVLRNLLRNGTTLTAAIAELLDNAVTAKADNIHLSVTFIDGQWCLVVADDGHGMNKNKLISIQQSYQSREPIEEDGEYMYVGAGRFGVGYAAARAVLTKNSGTTIIISHFKETPNDVSEERMYDMLGFAKCTMTLDMSLDSKFMTVRPDQDLGEESRLWEKYAIAPRKRGTVFIFPLDPDNVDEIKRNLFNENLKSNMALVFADRYTHYLSGEYQKADQLRRGEYNNDIEDIKLNIVLKLDEEDPRQVNLIAIPNAWNFVQKEEMQFKRKFTFKRLKETYEHNSKLFGEKVLTLANMVIYNHTQNKHAFILEHQDIGSKGKLLKKYPKTDERDWIQNNMADQELLQVTAVHIGELENYINYLRPIHETLGIKVPLIPLQRNKNGKIVHDSQYPFDELFRPKLTRNGYRLTLDKREKAEQTHETFRIRTIYDYSFQATPERDDWMAVEINKMRSSRNNMNNCIIAGMYQIEAKIMEGRLKKVYKKLAEEQIETNSLESELEDEEEEEEDDMQEKAGIRDEDFLMGQEIATHQDDMQAVKSANLRINMKKPKVVMTNVCLGTNQFTNDLEQPSEDSSDEETQYVYSSVESDVESGSGMDTASIKSVKSVTIAAAPRVVDEYVADNGLKASEVIHALKEIAAMTRGSVHINEVQAVLNKVHVNLWDKFIIAKGRECHFHKFYKENPLSLDKLFETIMNDIEEFYNNDRGVLGGANIKALYKKLKEEAEEQLEEDAY